MQNIVVLGASNSRVPNSFYAGLCGEEEGEFKFHNLSVGGSESLHKIYLLHNEKHKELLQNADLLILETNIMDDAYCSPGHLNVDSHIIEKHIKWLYEELYKFGKKVLICNLFSPLAMAKFATIKDDFFMTGLHEKLCRHYGFNFINFHQKMLDLNLEDYCAYKLGWSHILSPIMYEFGKNIRLNFKNFLSPKKEVTGGGNPEFVVVSPQELNSNLNEDKIRDVYYNEKVFWLKENEKFIFPKKYEGMQLVGIHSFTPGRNIPHQYASLIFQNKTTKIVKPFRSYNDFTFLFNGNFFIDEETFIKDNISEEITETSHAVNFIKGKANTLTIEGGVRLVGFLLANTKNSRLLDEKDLNLQNSDAYDFTHLVPPIDLYKDIIESFIIHNKLLSEAEFKAKFKEFANPAKFYENSAKARIHRHLAYKLGKAMIRNSKSFFGILKMPFILISLAISHKEELENSKFSAVKLPPLETCSDYQEALKEKNCFTYKLGLAFIKANKTWFKGGHFKFFFKDLPKLKAEFKAKKEKRK